MYRQRLGETLSHQLPGESNLQLAGWTLLRRDNPHEAKSALLTDLLQRGIFDGYSFWRFFREPALGLVVLLFVWLVIRAWRKERWKRNMWNTRGKKIVPATPAKPKPVFVWDESQGID